jgi:hypothetical protein
MIPRRVPERTFFALALLCCAACADTRGARVVDDETGALDTGPETLRASFDYDPRNLREPVCLPPTLDDPFFRIVVRADDWTGGPGAELKEVRVNGTVTDCFYVRVDGALRYWYTVTRKESEARNIVVVAHFPWHDGGVYDVETTIRGPKARRVAGEPEPPPPPEAVTRVRVHAPPRGGVPAGWAFAKCFVVEEHAGLARAQEPVDMGLCLPRERVADPDREIRLFRRQGGGDAEVPFQLYAPHVFDGLPKPVEHDFHRPSWFSRLVFFADSAPKGRSLYVLAYGNPVAQRPAPPDGLAIRGEGLGLTLENAHFAAKLDPKSGQIDRFIVKGGGAPVELFNSMSVAHWNPDTFHQSNYWAHAFGWNPPPRVETPARGPLVFRQTRSGPFERVPEMDCHVTYTFYAHAPYVLIATALEVRKPYAANAIRNGEMVFHSPLFTHWAWKAADGTHRTLRTLANPDQSLEAAKVLPADVPWVCLFHERERYGFAGIHRMSYAFNRETGVPQTYRPGVYLYSHPQWEKPLTYFVRALVYPFSYAFRGPPVQMDVGNVYVEEGAYLPFRLGGTDAPFEALDDLEARLRSPLQVRYGG